MPERVCLPHTWLSDQVLTLGDADPLAPSSAFVTPTVSRLDTSEMSD